MASEYDNLKPVASLGQGRYGEIELVRHARNDDYFALRVARETHDATASQTRPNDLEPAALAALTSPLIVRLFSAFGDARAVYLLLERSAGEELLRLFADESLLQATSARFFVVGMIEAFDQMCQRVLIYRRLNGTGDNSDHPQCRDLGFGKLVLDRIGNGCGIAGAEPTAQKAPNWYVVGVLIYEMVSSYPPFYDEDPMKTYARIMRAKMKDLPDRAELSELWRRYA